MWKVRLRSLLVWSSVPPLLAFYRLLYRLAIWISVMLFRQCKGIVAVYLCRGCAKGEITPGVSDIDFILIVGPEPTDRRPAEKAFLFLRRVSCGLIQGHPTFVQTEQDVLYRWTNSPHWRYRYQEGKSNWSLRYGRDVLSTLPAITPMERRASCFGEMHYWWMQFCDFMLQHAHGREDAISRHSICYKTVSEVLNVLHAMRTGEFCYSRSQALRREDSPLCRRLLQAHTLRLAPPDPALEEDVYRFLVAAFVDLWSTFPREPFLVVYPGVEQVVEPAEPEGGLEKAQPPFREIERHLLHAWGGKCRGLHLLKSASYQLQDWLLVIDTAPGSLPALADLERLVALRASLYSRQTPVPYFFLRVGQLVFPFTPAIPADFIRGVLTPATAPDVFLQLGEAPVYWTSHTKWYLTDWQRNRQWLTALPLKQLQLEAIARSAEAGHVRYPLGLASLEGLRP